MRRENSGALLICLILFSLIPEYEFRRGGGGGRVGGGSRSGGGFGRGSSGARTSSGGGGIFGGGSSSSGAARNNQYSRQTNFGGNAPRQNPSSYPKQPSGGGGYYNGGGSGSKGGGLFGNLFGRKTGNSGSFGRNRYGGFSSSGIGSHKSGSKFKNFLLGAAAGYVTYKAGQALIRHAAGPMYYNSRPYYWGQNYYRSSPGRTKMCSMPLDSDSQFSNMYFQDQTRPREITWGCSDYEYCCGYECCRGGSADSIGGHGRGTSIGYIGIP
ncbi:unnamed protein product [Caenorhabditis angaria]|uniref:CX domain-containing protein n=1 Tax=Caenorhabditis angaria TaxID=860376 RepID=A0A9P1N076_9PELO|nr:unnamed protein product [Caenorhabditis angaria]